MTDDTPWEPPLAGDELGHLTGMLDRLRTTFRWKADGLDATQLATGLGASTLTLGSLLKHLAAVEAMTFTWKLHGTSPGSPWADSSHDWTFTSAAGDTPEQLYAHWDDEVRRSRGRLASALATGGLDQSAHIASDDGEHASLRRLICDLIEEYGRHTGHADLLRESVDGRTGEDPPPGWRATSGDSPVGCEP
ncbi:hypothetical protein J2S43_002840 [Catenuloplanes nepalensis]|uniref:Mini-circle protein n=1 Tax=Catenuloplanes nepalensis TaxID=587533 RepID=A0ABT9MSU3_9ACTN|nr:DUF664 domain-containing protein [Catenuloplanes nepalensis]MDP9794328.1 hypothetical protein [Catenuloplanes nepalensis]